MEITARITSIIFVIFLFSSCSMGAWVEDTASLGATGDENGGGTGKYIIVSLRRSGSTWLCDMLKSHPQIENYGELVTYQRLHNVAETKNNSTGIERFLNELSPNLRGPFDYGNNWEEMLNVCLEEPLDLEVKSVGLKWIFSDGLSRHVDQVVAYCNKNDVKVIFLHRKNYLRQAISMYDKGVMHEKYNIKKKETLPDEQAVDIPVQFLQNKIKW